MASVAVYELETLGFCYTIDNFIFYYISSYCTLKITSLIQLATVCPLQKLRFFFKTCTCANFNFQIFKCLERTLPFTRQTKSVSLGALNRGTTIIVMRFPICIVDSFEC